MVPIRSIGATLSSSAVVIASRLLGIVTILASPATASAQDPRYPFGDVRWASSSTVDPRTITGVVYDLESGQPVAAAQVSIPSHGVGVLSQQDGRFRLVPPTTGPYQVEVQRIGYWSLAVPVEVAADRGIALSAGLRPARFDQCGDLVVYPPGVEVSRWPHIRAEVRDVATGRAPAVPIVIRAAGAVSTDSMRVEPAAGDVLTVQLDLTTANRPSGGTLDVSVTSPDHAVWREPAVLLEHACPNDRSPILRVWLLPE